VNGTGGANPGTNRISLSLTANGASDFESRPLRRRVAPVLGYSCRRLSPFGNYGRRLTEFIDVESPAEADQFPQGPDPEATPLPWGVDPEARPQAPTGGEGPLVNAVAGWLV
jgi:hypothetical protein